MRLLINALIALVLIGILVSALQAYLQEQHRLRKQELVHVALLRLHDEALMRAALKNVETSKRGFPLLIAREWFDQDVPTNRAVPRKQPWMDVAPPNDMEVHPPDPVIRIPNQAGFWYNPNHGIFRARVMPQFSERETLALYNHLNGLELLRLPDSREPSRHVVPNEPPDSSMGGPAPASPHSAPPKQPPAALENGKSNDNGRPTLNDRVRQ
ncbi:MAG: hypothetical protein QGH33_05210 [Pirellulaceae bacterium]|jgi:hypothetical protein|nr:hypothetical protein [Pirellulaceae bacterium]